ncbi:SRPBCC family protein [Ornithinibacillus halotolerans]|uniref:Activator of Hsp90 ATPase homologue 1/2-like C-terminal domain-containing protein n=1 Tax=Ornithinibacillus halotolerans TaxID=1274357 RepID=A0A916RUB7_9BACI|nr:SRPBCC domain-containing protein [Ornithinibacillus halotolerans]GGA67911.1 hypothetical protein GCM10008025_09700 [Ornithinibacillus halotolerans]
MPEINHSTYIKAPVEKVYQTLTSAEGWNAWFTDNTMLEMDYKGNGEIILRWENFGSDQVDIEDGGKILEVVSNKRFVFQWSPGEQPSTVRFELEPYREGTAVTLYETGYTNSEKDLRACIQCAVGWGEALTLLKVYLEHGIVYKEDL